MKKINLKKGEVVVVIDGDKDRTETTFEVKKTRRNGGSTVHVKAPTNKNIIIKPTTD